MRDVVLPHFFVRKPLFIHVSRIFLVRANFGGALSVLFEEGMRVVHSMYIIIPLQE